MSEAKHSGPANRTITLTDNATGKTYQLPILSGSVGPDVIDIRKLYSDTGYFTFDPGVHIDRQL